MMNKPSMKKYFSFARDLLASHIFPNKKFAFSASVIITTKCNQQCSYCIYYKKPPQDEMTASEVKKVIDDLSGRGIQRLCFTGGEPLLREDLSELVDYAKEKHIITTVVSNGQLLRDRLDYLKNTDILILSLDGQKTTHEKLRGEGTFENVISAIETAAGQKWVTFILCVITKHTTIEDLDFIIKTARKNNVYCSFHPVMYTASSESKSAINDLCPSKEKFSDLIDFLLARKKQGAPVAGSYSYFNLLKKLYRRDAVFQKKDKCWAGRGFCAVGPSGEIAVCCNLLKEGTGPNVLKEGFARAYDKLPMKFSCQGCMSYSSIETSSLFSLDISCLREIFSKQYFSKKQ